jgi:hypothetical protein
MAARYGAETPVLDWRERLVCSKCGSREIDMVMTGTKRRPNRPRRSAGSNLAGTGAGPVRLNLAAQPPKAADGH